MERYFCAVGANVYLFHGLEFTYIGKQAAAPKAHWAPYPYPTKGIKGKGNWKGKQGGKDRVDQDSDKKVDNHQARDPASRAANWFT